MVRIAPVKTTFELDPALLRRVKVWAGRRVLHVAPVVRALLADLVQDEQTGARIAERLAAEAARPAGRRPPAGEAPPSPVKTTYDVDLGLYGDFVEWVTDHETSHVAVLRLLMRELLAGGELARRVEARAAAAEK